MYTILKEYIVYNIGLYRKHSKQLAIKVLALFFKKLFSKYFNKETLECSKNSLDSFILSHFLF